MTDQRDLDQELLDLLKGTRDVPLSSASHPAASDAAAPGTAWDLAQRAFELDQAEYDAEMNELSQPAEETHCVMENGRLVPRKSEVGDDQAEWREFMREQGRLL